MFGFPLTGPVSFAVDLLVGGVALHVGARYVAAGLDGPSVGLEHAVVTALFGAVVWAVLSLVPLVGPFLALVGWLGVLKYRYPVGWVRAATIAVLAWVAAVVAVAALGLLGLDVSAFGVPGA